jgi:hypothetical protein
MVNAGPDVNNILSSYFRDASDFTLGQRLSNLETVWGGRDPIKIDMDPPQYLLEIMADLERAGYESPIIFGGVLRDAYLTSKGIVKSIPEGDVDIYVKPSKEKYVASDAKIKDEDVPSWLYPTHLAAFLKDDLANSDTNIQEIDISQGRTYKEFDVTMKAKYQTQGAGIKDIDLCFCDRELKVEGLAVSGDAPINSIAMDRNGNIYAHPDFEDHARKLVYSSLLRKNAYHVSENDKFSQLPDQENRARAMERLESLSQKIPGIRDIGTSGDRSLKQSVNAVLSRLGL